MFIIESSHYSAVRHTVVYPYCDITKPNKLLRNIFLLLIHYEILLVIQHCPPHYNASPNRSVAILCV